MSSRKKIDFTKSLQHLHTHIYTFSFDFLFVTQHCMFLIRFYIIILSNYIVYYALSNVNSEITCILVFSHSDGSLELPFTPGKYQEMKSFSRSC